MSIGILGIGVSGLSAAQAGLVTSGHNIANASTAGYSRQEVLQTENDPQLTGAGFIGQGVRLMTVTRAYSDFLSNQVTSAQTQGSEYDTYLSHIKQIDNMLGDWTAGLAPTMQDFFSSVNAVAANPADIPSRQALLSSAGTLAARFQTLDRSLEEIRNGLNGEIRASVNSINNSASQIAALNKNIMITESAGNRQQANDLRDQRDQLVADLGKEIRATVVKQSDGTYNVFVGNGQPIVVGTNTFALSAAASLEDAQRVEVGYASGSVTVLLGASTLQGGKLGGLLSFRAQTLDAAQNSLGRLAIGLAQEVNDQHRLGQDLNGALGTDLFRMRGPNVLERSSNAGTAVISASLQNVAALTASDYRLQYQGASAGNEQFLLTRLDDGATTSMSFPSATGYPHSQTVDGVTITVAAGAAANDAWLIQPSRQGAGTMALAISNPAEVAAASPIRTSAALSNRGAAAISTGSVSSVANLPLAGPVTLTYSAATGTFAVAGAVPAVAAIAYASGGAISFNGLDFTISGAPADGDTFTVGTNIAGLSDGRNATVMAALQSTNTLGGVPPTTSFQGAYGQLVSQVGNKARQIDVLSQAQVHTVAQARESQQSLSGVNLDEEAANLMRYQQAYQASGKMMQIAASLFQTVLDLGK